MIPKVIHYCWFGPLKQGELILSCIESWKKTNPSFEIRLWTESTFDVTSHAFTAKMYKEKKWAFVADYVRLVALYTEGGIYLDTDMRLVQSLDPLLHTELLLGKESENYVSCGMIGAVAHHPFIGAMMKEYDTLTTLEPNPVIMTRLWKKLAPTPVTVLPPVAFYPFTSYTITQYRGQRLSPETYGVHLWDHSWGHPLNKLFKRLRIHRAGTWITEQLGIKTYIKKLLGFI